MTLTPPPASARRGNPPSRRLGQRQIEAGVGSSAMMSWRTSRGASTEIRVRCRHARLEQGCRRRPLSARPLCGEQLGAPGAAAGSIGARSRAASAACLPRRPIRVGRIEACHRLGHRDVPRRARQPGPPRPYQDSRQTDAPALSALDSNRPSTACGQTSARAEAPTTATISPRARKAQGGWPPPPLPGLIQIAPQPSPICARIPLPSSPPLLHRT